jgi:hypothetical protein
MVLPIVGMGMLGVIAVWWPQVLGNGYEAVNAELLGGLPLTLLLVLPFLKLAVTALCSSSASRVECSPVAVLRRAPRGAVGESPSGASRGRPTERYALVGMGAALAGTTHARSRRGDDLHERVHYTRTDLGESVCTAHVARCCAPLGRVACLRVPVAGGRSIGERAVARVAVRSTARWNGGGRGELYGGQARRNAHARALAPARYLWGSRRRMSRGGAGGFCPPASRRCSCASNSLPPATTSTSSLGALGAHDRWLGARVCALRHGART